MRLDWAGRWASTLTWTNRRSVSRRWDELASQRCHAWNEIDDITSALQGTDERKEAPSFDLGVSHSTTVSWSNKRYTRLVSAYRALRLPEVAGLSPVNFDKEGSGIPIGVATGILTLAADELAAYIPELAIRIILRISRYEGDKIFLRVLSRTRIASLSDDATETLAQVCRGVIDYTLPRLFTPEETTEGVSSVERLRVAIEILSRLILRVNPERVADALDLGLECYRAKGVVEHHWLAGPIGNLLKRSWEALPKNLRGVHVFDLLTAPIPGLDGFSAVSECVDPGSLVVHGDLPIDGTPEYAARSSEVVNILLRGLRSTSGTARNIATIRLLPLVVSGGVRDDQAFEIANVLWRGSDPVLSNATGPGSPYDWVFMLLPEVSPGQAERSFRQKWLTPQNKSEDDPSGYVQEMLYQLGPALANSESRERLLPLTTDESEYVSVQLLRFVKTFFGSTVTLSSNIRIRYMNTVVGAITIPDPIANELFGITAMMLGAESVQVSDPLQHIHDLIYDVRIAISYSLIPGLVRAFPDRADTMVMWLSAGLASGEQIRVNNAMLVTRSWALTPEEPALPPAPDNLIREVGAIIASRRKDVLADALSCATFIFDRGIQSHRGVITSLCYTASVTWQRRCNTNVTQMTRTYRPCDYSVFSSPDTCQGPDSLRMLL